MHKAEGWRAQALKALFTVPRLPKGQEPILVVALTALYSVHDRMSPDVEGINRLLEAEEELDRFPKAKLAIIGDYPDPRNGNKKLSEKYFSWHEKNRPDQKGRTAFWGGVGNCTVKDVVSVKEELEDFVRREREAEAATPPTQKWVGISTDLSHFYRIMPTFFALGYQPYWVENRYKIRRSALAELVGLLVTIIDPYWESSVGQLLAERGNRAAAAHFPP